jgi:16S rRNA (adenine1518-N6/adenine1519-N6)-dimethyltransferase
MELLERHLPIKSITVMVQKEVADRMQTGPGSKDYGALSLAVQYYTRPELVMEVPPSCFLPRPKVGSAVIHLECHEKPPVEVRNEGLLFDLIRASFNQRRKTLANGIKNAPGLSFSREDVENALMQMEKSVTVRGEALTLEEFAMLANLLEKSYE